MDGFRRGPTPPDIDEIVKKFKIKLIRFFPGGSASGGKPILFGLVVF